MDRTGGAGRERASIWKVAAASTIGTSLEWYDFFLYLTASALVFNQLFFPSFDPLTGTIAAFATGAVGFVARPLGGIVFGHFGDRIGRKQMLVITLVIMGVATALIGVLPTYESVGILAPILLVTLRVVQGFGVGGEWGGAVLMAIEHAPQGRRGFFGSLPQVGVPAGLVLADGVFILFERLPEEAFLTWGWRVPFLLSALLVAVGLYVRLRVEESPAFEEAREGGEGGSGVPALDLVRNDPKNVLLAMGARLGDNVLFYIFSVFVLSYATEQLGLPESLALTGVLIAATIEIFTVPAFGALSDRIGRRPVYISGAVFCALLAFPYFWLLNTEATVLIWLAIVLSLPIGHAAMYAPQASFLSELFGTSVRYSGASIGYQLAPIVGGGIAPTVATVMLATTGGAYWPIAVYMILMALVTVVSVFIASETAHNDVSDASPEERDAASVREPAG